MMPYDIIDLGQYWLRSDLGVFTLHLRACNLTRNVQDIYLYEFENYSFKIDLSSRGISVFNINLVWYRFSIHIENQSLYPRTTKLLGGILVSICPSVCPSRICSVAPTVLVESILYQYILSSNLRRCVACNSFLQNFEVWIFGNFLKFETLTLSFIWTNDGLGWCHIYVSLGLNELIHCGLLVSYEQFQHWSRWICCLMAPSRYLNQVCLISCGMSIWSAYPHI